MPIIPYHRMVQTVEPHIAKIVTPRGHGTGFLFAYNTNRELTALATADHVVSDAEQWDEPIRIEQQTSGQSFILRRGERAIFRYPAQDIAVVLFATRADCFPADALLLIGENAAAKSGADIGWLGFPGIAP